MKKERKKVFKTIIIVSVVTFAVCLIMGKLLFSLKPVFVFNHAIFIVGSSSMEPEYPVRSLIVVKREPLSMLKEGDVIVYKSDALGGGLAFHRVVRASEGGLYTKGDNNEFGDNQLITEKSYVGKGVFKNYPLGKYLFSVGTPVGFVVFFLLPLSSLWLIYRAGKRVRSAIKYG